MTLWTLFSDPTPPHPPGGFGTGLAGDWILPISDSKNPYFGPKTRFFAAPAGAFAPHKVQMDKMHLRFPH